MTPLLRQLAAIVGSGHVLTEAGDLARYQSDGRGATGHAFAVARPADAAQVAAVLACAIAAGVRIVPQGANSGLVGAGVADVGMLVLSLERLSGEPVIDPVNRTAQVGAGVRLSVLNAAAAVHGLYFPIDLGADPSIGGMVAANTGGARFLRYGDVRRNLLALDVVTAEAEPRLLQLGAALWKDNSGVDLKQLFVGTSGSFGIVTSATLALSPKPATAITTLLALADPAAAIPLLVTLEAAFGGMLSAFEGLSGAALAAALAHVPRLRDPFPGRPPCYAVLIELSAGGAFDADLLEDRLASVLQPDFATGNILDCVVDRRDGLWAIRHAVPEGLRAAGRVLACDIALRRGDVMAFRAAMAAQLVAIAPQLQLHDFGHIGDGGLHFNLVWPRAAGPVNDAVISAARTAIFDTVVTEYGGSFSAEHGIGPANLATYSRHIPAPVRCLSGALQRLVAPAGIGRVDFANSSQEKQA